MFNFSEGYKNSLVLRDYIDQNYLNDDEAILVKRGWRAWGFLQTMYHRNIFCTSLYTDQQLITEAVNRNCQYIIYLTEGEACYDTGVYNDADIYDIRDGTVIGISSKTGKIVMGEMT